MTRGSLVCSALFFSLVWTPYSLVGSMPGVAREIPPRGKQKEEATPMAVSLDLTMPLTRIGPKDDLVVAGKLKNVSGKNLPYYDTAQPWLRFHEKSTKQDWVTKASLYPPPAGAPPTLQSWKAGAEKSFTVRLHPETKYGHRGAKPETARLGLPPGKYQLYCEMQYVDHYPELKKNPLQGTLSPAPIDFEVVEK